MGTAPSHPDRRCLVEHMLDAEWTGRLADHGGAEWGPEVCRRMIMGLAGAITSLGIDVGERVLVVGPNSASFVIAYFAVHAMGGVAVPAGPDVSEDGLQEIREECDPRLEIDLRPGVQVGRSAVLTGQDVLEHFKHAPLLRPRCTIDRPADLLFTTGTSGRRKGVLLSHRNISAIAGNINAFIPIHDGDTELVPIPFGHSFGLGRVRCWALAGHHLIAWNGFRNLPAMCVALRDRGVTGLALVPAAVAMLRTTIGHRFAEYASAVRYIELGSAPMEELDVDWLLQQFPAAHIVHHYGLTEASRSAFSDLRRDRDPSGFVGHPAASVMLGVFDPLDRSCGIGEHGEIRVRGDTVLRGYWRRPALDQQAFHSEWLRTGDEGFLDPLGRLHLVGRRSDLINVGGLKVAPDPVEQALKQLPGVLDAACVGVRDPRGLLGQVVKAFLVTEAPLDEGAMRRELRGPLAEHEIPALFEKVESIPRTSSGKLQRHLLRTSTANDPVPPQAGRTESSAGNAR